MTMFDENHMAGLLESASAAAPPSRVDLGSVLRDGHRRRHRRRALVPLAAAAAVALVAGIVASVQLRPQGLTPAPPATASPTPPVLDEFPLDRQLVALDGPGELTSIGLGRQQQSLTYSDGAESVSVTVYPVGITPPSYQGEFFDRVEAPSIDGLPARFVTSAPYDELMSLEFQWAPGAWAELQAFPQSEAHLLSLAQDLHTVDEPVRFVFSVEPPPGLSLAYVVAFEEGEEATWAGLEFTADGMPAGPPDSGIPWVDVEVGEYFDSALDPAVNAEIDGRPAYIEQWADAFSIEMRDTDPYRVKVVVHGEVLSMADAQELVASVIVHGTWEDRSQWTDDPLR